MSSVVVLFAYTIKLDISRRKELQKLYQRSYSVILTDFCITINKMLDKILFHKQFKKLYFYTSILLTIPRSAELFMAAPIHPKAAIKKINAPAAMHKFAAFAQLYCSQISA